MIVLCLSGGEGREGKGGRGGSHILYAGTSRKRRSFRGGPVVPWMDNRGREGGRERRVLRRRRVG